MDDLTALKGIGASTAKLLAGSGLASFAALAALDPASPPQIEGLRSPDWVAWIAEAASWALPTPETGSPAPPLATPPTSTAPVAASKTEGDAMIVTGPKRGRWRAGIHFGKEPVRLLLSDLTDDERFAIEADPTLIISVEASPDV